ncbi:MAG: hypothetical protein JWP52_251 [Rhizobacter sp.]|nr:hypothetical protein [Rhizobacter sp.]
MASDPAVEPAPGGALPLGSPVAPMLEVAPVAAPALAASPADTVPPVEPVVLPLVEPGAPDVCPAVDGGGVDWVSGAEGGDESSFRSQPAASTPTASAAINGNAFRRRRCAITGSLSRAGRAVP